MNEYNKTHEAMLNWIKRYINDVGYPPSVREIGVAFRVSTSTTIERLEVLQDNGYIRRDEKISRGIVILK